MTKFKNSRLFIQLSFLAYITVVSIGKAFNLSWGESVHAICPLGAVESLSTYLKTGTFIKHTGEGNWVMMVALFLISLMGGAIFCGWICPFGTIQEFIGKIGDKLGLRKNVVIPKKLDKILRGVKYFVLIFILVQTGRYFKLVFETYDPYYTFFNIWSSDITLLSIALLIIILLLSLVKERAYCKYLCPLGAINGIMNKINIFRLKRDNSTCIDCKLCDKACPMNIEVSKVEDVKDLGCTKCLKCIDACPVNLKNNNQTLAVKGIKKNWILAPLMLVFFLGPIAIGSAAGKFQEADEVKSYETPEDIRGSFTLDDLIKNYGVEKGIFIKGFGLPENYNSNLKIKELSSKDITLDDIRNFIRFQNVELKEIEGIKLIENSVPEKSLKENIQLLPLGSLKSIFSKEVATTPTQLEIKRKTMLVEVEKMVKNYDEFLKHFGISKSEFPNTTLNDLETKYNLKYDDMKKYIQENIKK